MTKSTKPETEKDTRGQEGRSRIWKYEGEREGKKATKGFFNGRGNYSPGIGGETKHSGECGKAAKEYK